MTTRVTPMDALIHEYIWKQRPPLTMTAFAAQVGLSPATLYNAMTGARRPEYETLRKIAMHTDIPLRTLLEAAGYDMSTYDIARNDVQAEWDYIIAQAPTYVGLDADRQHTFREWLKALRAKYEQGK